MRCDSGYFVPRTAPILVKQDASVLAEHYNGGRGIFKYLFVPRFVDKGAGARQSGCSPRLHTLGGRGGGSGAPLT